MYSLHNLIYHIRAFGISDEARSKLLASSKDEKSLIESARALAKKVSMPLEAANRTAPEEKPDEKKKKEAKPKGKNKN